MWGSFPGKKTIHDWYVGSQNPMRINRIFMALITKDGHLEHV